MKNLIYIFLLFLGLIIFQILGISLNNEVYNIEKKNFSQPPPLILGKDSNFRLQPIVENIDLKGYETIFTLKLYYKDKLNKTIYLSRGDSLISYCSDQTILRIWLSNNTKIELLSVEIMSCDIMALFNLNKNENSLLRKYPIYKIEIINKITDNVFVFNVQNTFYLTQLINKYPHWHLYPPPH
jgi:hypothetical protein